MQANIKPNIELDVRSLWSPFAWLACKHFQSVANRYIKAYQRCTENYTPEFADSVKLIVKTTDRVCQDFKERQSIDDFDFGVLEIAKSSAGIPASDCHNAKLLYKFHVRLGRANRWLESLASLALPKDRKMISDMRSGAEDIIAANCPHAKLYSEFGHSRDIVDHCAPLMNPGSPNSYVNISDFSLEPKL